MPENTTEKAPEELDPSEVQELEDGDLEAASGGLAPIDDQSNTNCGNTQCCG